MYNNEESDGSIKLVSDSKCIYLYIYSKLLDQRCNNWKSLKNQGRLASLTKCNQKCSQAILSNLHVSDKVVQFIIKARLQMLETTAMKHIYFPQTFQDSKCNLCGHQFDNTSHAMNGCMALRSLCQTT